MFVHPKRMFLWSLQTNFYQMFGRFVSALVGTQIPDWMHVHWNLGLSSLCRAAKALLYLCFLSRLQGWEMSCCTGCCMQLKSHYALHKDFIFFFWLIPSFDVLYQVPVPCIHDSLGGMDNLYGCKTVWWPGCELKFFYTSCYFSPWSIDFTSDPPKWMELNFSPAQKQNIETNMENHC